MTWGPVEETELPNPGSGIDGVRLANGHWVLVYNDSASSRASLAVSLSDDEGRTWKWTRHLERHAAGRYHYPAVIQGRDGKIHAIYSCFIAAGHGSRQDRSRQVRGRRRSKGSSTPCSTRPGSARAVEGGSHMGLSG